MPTQPGMRPQAHGPDAHTVPGATASATLADASAAGALQPLPAPGGGDGDAAEGVDAAMSVPARRAAAAALAARQRPWMRPAGHVHSATDADAVDDDDDGSAPPDVYRSPEVIAQLREMERAMWNGDEFGSERRPPLLVRAARAALGVAAVAAAALAVRCALDGHTRSQARQAAADAHAAATVAKRSRL